MEGILFQVSLLSRRHGENPTTSELKSYINIFALKSSYLTYVSFKQNVFSRIIICTSLKSLLRSLSNLPKNLGKLIGLPNFLSNEYPINSLRVL